MQFPDSMGALCRALTKVYGVPAQEAMAVGELGELLTLFGRRAQKRDSEAAWIDEIADGLIMLRQLAEIHGSEKVEARIAEKVEKLWNRDGIRVYHPDFVQGFECRLPNPFRPVAMNPVLGMPYLSEKVTLP